LSATRNSQSKPGNADNAGIAGIAGIADNAGRAKTSALWTDALFPFVFSCAGFEPFMVARA